MASEALTDSWKNLHTYLDNDSDGLADCDDQDCLDDPACLPADACLEPEILTGSAILTGSTTQADSLYAPSGCYGGEGPEVAYQLEVLTSATSPSR